MSETPPIPGGVDPLRVRAAATAPAGPARPGGAAFEALFERLTTRAAELEARAKTLEGAADLPDAVDAARASLEDALSLGEGLLEAFRAARQSGEGS